MESIAHQAAKNQLASWLTALAGKRTEIVTEYPVAINTYNQMLGLSRWPGDVPSYASLISASCLPIAIFDVAVLHRGWLCGAYEIVHSNPISVRKRAYLKRIQGSVPLKVWQVSADWILTQSRTPFPDTLRLSEATNFFTVEREQAALTREI